VNENEAETDAPKNRRCAAASEEKIYTIRFIFTTTDAVCVCACLSLSKTGKLRFKLSGKWLTAHRFRVRVRVRVRNRFSTNELNRSPRMSTEFFSGNKWRVFKVSLR